MSDIAVRDQNFVTSLLGVSSVDGVSPVTVYVNPTTHRVLIDSAGAGGTVTSVATGTGLTGGTITTTGTISLATSLQPIATLAGNSLKYLRVNAGETAVEWVTVAGSGTVTSVSVVTANGFSGSVATATTTPAITLAVTASAGSVLFSNGTALTQDATNFVWNDTANQLQLGAVGTLVSSNSQFALNVGSTINDYFGIEVQNRSNGDSASTDISISADNDDPDLVGHYIDIGIEGSGFVASAIGNIKSVTINAAGSGYAIGNVLTLTGGDSNATVTVSNTGGGGSVTAVTLSDAGTGYSVASGLATTGGGGSGCTINVVTLVDTTLYSANDGYTFISGGNLILGTDDSVAGKVIKFHTNGTASTNERMRIADALITVGLTGTTLGKIAFAGSTSTSITLQGQAVGSSSVLTLPTGTDTLVGKATTDTLTNKTLTSALITTKLSPTADDGAPLGDTTHNFSDLFLASGAVLNYANSNVVITHTSGILTMGTGDLRVTTAGTNTASVVTVGGTQTLTAKTLTSPTLTTPSAFTTGGDITLAENTSIVLDPAGSADGKYSGITMTATGGATIAFGDLVYLDAATSRWKLTDADASATGGPVDVAMAVTSSTDGNPLTILRMGNIRADAKFPALTIGAPVYLGETAGTIQVAIPTGADNVIRVVGFALTADEIFFHPSQDHQISVA